MFSHNEAYFQMANWSDKYIRTVGIYFALSVIHPKALPNEFVTSFFDDNLSSTSDIRSTPAFEILLPQVPEALESQQQDKNVSNISGDVDSWFHVMSITHRSMCGEHISCEDDTVSAVGMSTCCGSCTCDSNCVQHGSCCLGVYHNFTHGRNAVQSTRYAF